jgi:hypothetical protein
VKRRQRTHAASGGASEALPHEVGARPSRSEPKLNTHALYPSRSELRGITFKNKPQSSPAQKVFRVIRNCINLCESFVIFVRFVVKIRNL